MWPNQHCLLKLKLSCLTKIIKSVSGSNNTLSFCILESMFLFLYLFDFDVWRSLFWVVLWLCSSIISLFNSFTSTFHSKIPLIHLINGSFPSNIVGMVIKINKNTLQKTTHPKTPRTDYKVMRFYDNFAKNKNYKMNL